MNIERLNEVADWLEQGAPHIVFDMGTANEPVSDMLAYLEGEEATDDLLPSESRMLARIRSMQPSDNECGSVCCIAGYVTHLYGDEDQKNQKTWPSICAFALDALGLESNGSVMFHDLFDPRKAPDLATPEEAARAMRNLIAGKENVWEGVR